ncbi:MAG TPA: hypothetical protein PKU85_01685 [Bacteroidales bacterium]|nr:MAG: hypothetical protein BWX62_00306 [Bacteroidetes bacterium ADurb.Bin037]HPV87911.1 hypothetical protein [Bacteroidales bacterium]HPW78533.1 hypothetical protein [Bacteroidales bacterium]HQB55744.1 hypothetical protein [Bacteroidales bacterium]
MKRSFTLPLFTAIAIMFTSVQMLPAQQDHYDYITYTRHEIFLQYGAPTFQELSTRIRHETSVAKDGKIYVPERFAYTGVAALGYKYYTSPYMSFGGYLGISAAMMEMAGKDTGKVVFKSRVLSLTGLITAHWIYYRTGLWEISAHAAAGITKWTDDQEMIISSSRDISRDTVKWRFAYHLSPLHIRWGGTFGLFADLGLGYKGIFNMGFSVKF